MGNSTHYLLHKKPADSGPIFASSTDGNNIIENALKPNRQFWKSGGAGTQYIRFYFQDRNALYVPQLIVLYNLLRTFTPNVGVRLQLSNDPLISITTINGNYSIGATTISISSTNALTIEAGDKIFINNINQTYTVQTGGTWISAGNQNITITPGLVSATPSGSDVFRCRIDNVVYDKSWVGILPINPWGVWTPYSLLPWGGYNDSTEWYQDNFIKEVALDENIFQGMLTLSGLTTGNYCISRLFIGEVFISNGFITYPANHKTIFPNGKAVRATEINYQRISASDRNEIEKIAHTTINYQDDVLFYLKHGAQEYVYAGNIPKGDISVSLTPGLDEWAVTLNVTGYS